MEAQEIRSERARSVFYHRDLLPFLPRPRGRGGPSIISAQKAEADCFHSRWKVPGSAIVQNEEEGRERITAPLLPPPRPVLFVDYSCSCGGGKEQEKDLPRYPSLLPPYPDHEGDGRRENFFRVGLPGYRLRRFPIGAKQSTSLTVKYLVVRKRK